MSHTLHQLFLMVTDIERSIAFYRDVLELDVHREGTSSMEFDTGSCRLMLEEDFEPETLTQFGLEPPGDNRGAGVIVVVEVDSVESAVSACADADIEVVLEPTEVEWGRKMALVRDPDGYIIELSRPL